jgi:hypothetical protein
MRQKRNIRGACRAESGYALVLVMFILAILVLAMTEAAPTVLSSIQREKEKEMVWRGKQYTRGVRMYYMKLNRFPTSLDDLTKPKTGIRFMRQAYKDPMNQVDGSWRLIYVGPNGQLIGSLSDRSLGSTGQIGGMGIVGAQAGSPSLFSTAFSAGNGSGLTGGNSLNSSGFGMNQLGGNNQAGAVGTALANGSSAAGANGTADSSSPDPTQPHSLAGPMDASNTIGGNIIGVGSKINKKSFLIYQKAKNYRLFEFIWDPSQDTTVGRASAGIGTPVQNMNGQNPQGTATPNSPFGQGMNPMNPGQTPGQIQTPAQNPNPAGNPDPNQMPPLQAPPPTQ